MGCIFLFSGCSAPETNRYPVTQGICFTVTAKTEQQECTAKVSRYPEKTEVKILSPEKAKDLTLLFTGDSFETGLDSISGEKRKIVGNDNLFCLLELAFREAKGVSLTGDKEKTITVKVEGKPYVFTLSPSGFPLSLKGENKEFVFSDMTVISSDVTPTFSEWPSAP